VSSHNQVLATQNILLIFGNSQHSVMVIKLKKNTTSKQLNEKLLNRKPAKVIQAKKHLGKVNWGEDPLAYQKRKRNEWD